MQQEAICSYIIENLCGINEEDYKDTPKDLEALKKWRDILQSWMKRISIFQASFRFTVFKINF